MAKSVIGALRVDLGLNSAQFNTGIKTAQTRLASFGKAAGVALTGVAVAAAAAGAALGVMVKGAIDHADEIGKLSQRVGVSVEALSQLEFAAKLADVSLAELGTGLRKLSQNMLDLAAGRGQQAKTAFDALGISVKDATGELRASDDVLAEVAEKFSKMEDGTTKTALAVSLFGRSGAQLIPMLNAGRDGLQEMADEADRLGITLSGQTTARAEEFNDTLTRIQQIMQGVVNKIMEAALPALQSLAETLSSPAFAEAAQVMAVNIINGLNRIIEAVVSVINWFDEMERRARMDDAVGRLRTSLESLDNGRRNKRGEEIYGGMLGSDGKLKMLGDRIGAPDDKPGTTVFDPIIIGADTAKAKLTELVDTGDQFTDSARRMSQAIGDTLGGAFSRLADAVLSGNDALGATVDILGDLGKQLLNGAINMFFSNLFGGGFNMGAGLGAGAFGRGVYGGSGGFFPGFPGFASGTFSAPSGMAWVGENGPELVNFRGGEQVIPNHALGGMGGSGEVLVRLDQGLVGQIVKQNEQNAIRIVDSRAPLATARFQRNRGGGS